MEPIFERWALNRASDDTTVKVVWEIAAAMEEAYSSGQRDFIANANVFKCSKCNDTFSKRNEHEDDDGKSICNLCHESVNGCRSCGAAAQPLKLLDGQPYCAPCKEAEKRED